MKKNNTTVAVKKKKKIEESTLPKPFPIVGFGASAGGLEAFTSLLKNLDSNLGMAYVLVMHLSPNHKSSLTEILQTKTSMLVHTVKSGMEVKQNHIYIIPPNTFMSIVDGHLKLAPRSVNSIGNYAIDFFLTSLAAVYKNNAIGVILSGTATDGTLGLKAIKAEGGITFAQNDSAKFSGMPMSAQKSGYVDLLLSPEGIAKELGQLVKTPYATLSPHKIDEKHEKELHQNSEDLKKILLIVKEKTSVDFFLHYKQASIYRRIARRMVLNKFVRINDYYLMLMENDKEVEALYNDFLINVTSFFRDADFFKTLKDTIFPSIVKKENSAGIIPIRIWVAGCSTGEEAYSIAISLTEFLDEKNISLPIQIFASDLDFNALEKARLGIYSKNSLLGVSQNHLKRYFKKVGVDYQINKTTRELCIFSQQNLIKDPPFSRMDLISCQNVLIYLESDPQKKILQTFHYALKPTGFLFLGKSETIGSSDDLFELLDKKIRIYSPKSIKSYPLDVTLHKYKEASRKENHTAEPHASADVEKELSKLILSRFVHPCFVVNKSMTIIQFFGVTAPYLAPVIGKASFNILKIIREDLIIVLRSMLQQVLKTERIIIKEGIRIYNNKIPHDITIEVVPKKTSTDLLFLVVFKETTISMFPVKRKGSKMPGNIEKMEKTILALEEEIIQSRELIRTANEEYETTFEQLQANNEESLSSNEELQSVNEELETSKEELQSANEELTTINEEFAKRNVELKESQDYAKAIIETMHSPLLVLTTNLQVQMANKAFYKTFKLTEEKTEGNYIFELDNKAWEIASLRDHLNDLMIKKISFKEFELQHNFIGLGQLNFIVNAYKLLNDHYVKETLILLSFNNVSELLKVNKELQKVNGRLEEFAFISSHDLQEPLRKIETFSTFLLSPAGELNEYAKKYADKITTSASRMSLLLKDLLKYSMVLKTEVKKTVRVDLNEIINNVILDFEMLIEKTKSTINVVSLPKIYAEPIQMNELFYNLIGNAIKFGKEKPVIHIGCKELSAEDLLKYPELMPDKNYFAITVIDNGVGFDQQYATKIFTIFQRLNDKKSAEGTGLGLSICKKVVEDHGGLIFANGIENTGSTFTIILPHD